MLGRRSPTRGGRWGGEWGTPWGTVGSAVGRRVERAMEPARGGWGFCTIRSIATACRRRVAPLLMQFPPHRSGRRARNPVGHGGERCGARWGAPRGGEWGTPWGTVGSAVGRIVERAVADGGFAPLDASLRRVAGVSRPYWRNSPHRSDRRGRNPTSAPGRGTLPRGARWGTPWGTVGNPVGHGAEAAGSAAGRPDHALTDSEAGARPRAPPPLGPATSQVSRRSSGRPSVVPDPE